MPTTKKKWSFFGKEFGKEVKIKYTPEGFRELKATIRHERTHQLNPLKGKHLEALEEHFKIFPISKAVRERFAELGYQGRLGVGGAFDELQAIAGELRYQSRIGRKNIGEFVEASYGPEITEAAMMLAKNPKIQLAKSNSAAYQAGRIEAHMQLTTNMVKANTTGYTAPGLAQAARRGGSRQTPRGGS